MIAAAITSPDGQGPASTPLELSAKNYGLPKDSVVLLEQIRTLDKSGDERAYGRLDDQQMQKVDSAIAVSFGLHTQQLV